MFCKSGADNKNGSANTHAFTKDSKRLSYGKKETRSRHSLGDSGQRHDTRKRGASSDRGAADHEG